MTDVHDLLTRTHRALGEAEGPVDPARHDALLTGVRRRRRRRHAAEAAGVAALVVVLGTGGWFATQPDRAPQPAQSATPTPSTAPTPNAAAVLEAPGLPPAQPLPAGLLATTTPGWVLATVSPAADALGGTGGAGTFAQVVDLVSPEGERYRVADVGDLPDLRVVRWDAGDDHALVTAAGRSGAMRGGRLDLTTGELEWLPGLSTAEAHLGRTPAGEDLWDDPVNDRVLVHDGTAVVRTLSRPGRVLADPEGRWLAGQDARDLVVVDTTTGELTPVTSFDADELCNPLAWRGTELVVSCVDISSGSPQVVATLRVDVTDPEAGTQPVDLPGLVPTAPPGLEPGGSRGTLSDGRVAVAHSLGLECGHGWGVLDVDTGELTDVPVPRDEGAEVAVVRVDASGLIVLVSVVEHCSGDGGPVRVLRHDLATGTEIEVGAVPPTTNLPEGARWTQVTTSAVLAMP